MAVDVDAINQLAESLGPKKRNPLVAGVSSGTDELQGMLYGAGGAVADVVGAHDVRDWLNNRAKMNEQEAQDNGRPDLERIEDQSLRTAPSYLLYQGAKQIPIFAGAMAATALAPEVALPAGATRAAALLPRMLGGGGFDAAASFAARKAAVTGGRALASDVAGAAPYGAALGAGSMYNESVDAGHPDAARALMLAPAYGALEALSPAVAKGVMLRGSHATGGIAARVAKNFGVEGAGGAATELLQNEMEMSFNPGLSDDDKFSRRLNSAAAGGVLEGGVGALGGLRGRHSEVVSDVGPTNLLQKNQQGSLFGAAAAHIAQGTPGVDFEPGLAAQPSGHIGRQGELPLAMAEPEGPTRPTSFGGVTVQVPQEQGAAPGTVDFSPASRFEQAQVPQLSQEEQLHADINNYLTAQHPGLPTIQDPHPAPAAALPNPQQGELLHEQEAVIPVQQRPAAPPPAVQVQGVQPGQQTMLDEHGQPTYAAEQAAEPDWARAAQAVKMEFGIKGKGAQLNAMVLQAVQARMEGRIAEPDFQEFMSGVAQSPNRLKAHEKALATITTQQENHNAETVPTVQEGPQGPVPAQALQVNQENPHETQEPDRREAPAEAVPGAAQQPAVEAAAVPGAAQRVGSPQRGSGAVNGQSQQAAEQNSAAQNEHATGAGAVSGPGGESSGGTRVAGGSQQDGGQPHEAAQVHPAEAQKVKRFRRSSDTKEVESAIDRLNEAKSAGIYRNALVYLMDSAENSKDSTARRLAQGELDAQPKNNDDWKAAERKYGRLKKYSEEIQSDNAEAPSKQAKFSVQKEKQGGTTEKAVREQIAALTGEDSHWKVTVFPTLAAAQASGVAEAAHLKPTDQAFVVDDHAYFIAENIKPGSEQAVFLHEVGAHMGLEKTLTSAQFNTLADQIETWAQKADGSQESEIAQRALERAGEDKAERVAYFIEEAVDAGVNPTANTSSSELARWFNALWSAFKDALTKLGLNPEGMSAQDVVDLAYGAAHAELNEARAETGAARVAAQKMVSIETSSGLPAFRNEQIALANPKLAESFPDGTKQVIYDIVDVPKLREAKASGAHPSTSKVGQLLVNVKDGRFESFRNIEIRPTLQSQGYGTKVLEALLATNPDGHQMEVWDIRKEENSKGQSAKDWWDARGVKRNFSDIDMLVGKLDTESYLAKTGKQNDESRPAQDAKVGRNQGAREGEAAHGRQGGDDEGVGRDRQTPQYSRATSEEPHAGNKLLDWASDLVGDHGRQLTREFMTLRQLESAFADKFKAIGQYAQNALKMGATAEHAMLGYAKIQQAILSLKSAQQDTLFDLMTQSTLDGIHPNVALADPLNAEAAKKQGAYEKWAKLNAQWNKLDAKSQAAYGAARDEFKANWEKRIELIDAKMNSLLPQADLAQWRETKNRWMRQLQGPYFPLMRFGRWVTVWKSAEYVAAEAENNTKALHEMKANPSHYSVEFNDSKSVADRQADTLRKRGGEAYSIMHNDYESEAVGLNKGFVDKLEHALSVQFGNTKEGSAAVATLKELYAHALPDYNAMKRTLQRRGVAGVKSADMMRSLSRAGMADAYYLARLEHADGLTDALHDLKQQDTNAHGGDGSLYSLMLKRHTASMKRIDTPLQNMLTNLTYVNMLGSSPAFMLINGMQPFMVTLPMLGARHGWAAGSKALASGTADAGRILKTNFSEQGWRFELNFDPVAGKDPLNLKDDERAMLKGLLDSGLIDITIAHDLSSMAYGGNAKYNTAMKLATTAPQYVEVVNRIATALAAYRLEKAKSGETSANKYAERAVAETQLDYSAVNTPYRMMPGVTPLARVLFQFRKYQQGMIWLLANNFGKALKGDKEARNMLFGLLATHGSMAGVAGLPVAFPIAILAKIVAQAWDDDDEPDPESMWRNFLADIFGVEGGRVVQKGLPAALGIDISGRVGLGNVFNPLPQMEWRGTLSDTWKEMLAGAISPSVANLGNYLKAGDSFTKGDWGKGLEYTLPKMLADPLKAMRFSEQGVTTKGGNVAIAPKDVSGWDAALRAIGLSSTKFSEYYDAKAMTDAADARIKTARTGLIGEYIAARRAGDQEKLNAIQTEVSEFNTRHQGDHANLIRMSTLLQAWNGREKYTRQTNDAGIRVKKGEGWKNEMSRFAAQ